MDYTETLDKALRLLRELQLDKALQLLYSLLEDHPKDLELIDRIYNLELKHTTTGGLKKICHHIFSLASSREEFRQRILTAFIDFKSCYGIAPTLSEQQIHCTLPHLARSHLSIDTEHLLNRIKHEFFDSAETPQLLSLYCEILIEKGQYINARSELRYLITYYIETQWGQSAIGMLRSVEQELRTGDSRSD